MRAAFNSPFWPFVLATTSIGPEGLDFHPYCHAVIHWNLPNNPVDRHAIRKNVAKLVRNTTAGQNPWNALFKNAEECTGLASEIVPYWAFPIKGRVYRAARADIAA